MDQEAELSVLKHLIAIPSVNDHEADVADYIASLFDGKPGVKIEKVTYAPGRDNLVVTVGDGERPLGFSGHEDVVSPGDRAAWHSDPFTATVNDGRLIGRGAADMKSGLAAVVCAMLEMIEEGGPAGPIRLLASVGEETGNYGAAQLTKAAYADNLGGLVIAEPSNGMRDIDFACKGVIDYKVTAVGKSAHSSRPQEGVNAISHLLEFANKVEPMLDGFTAEDPILGKLVHSITKFNGGEQVNNIPSHAELMGNIRTTPATPNKEIYAALEKLVAELNQEPDHHLTLTYSYPEEAVPGTPDEPLVKLANKVHQDVFGEPAKLTATSGTSDGSEYHLAKGDFDIIEAGPGSQSSHQSNEYVELDAFYKAIEFYKKLAKAFFED